MAAGPALSEFAGMMPGATEQVGTLVSEHDIRRGLFLGAGASVRLGLPTTTQFFLKAFGQGFVRAVAGEPTPADPVEALLSKTVPAAYEGDREGPHDVEHVIDYIDRAIDRLQLDPPPELAALQEILRLVYEGGPEETEWQTVRQTLQGYEASLTKAAADLSEVHQRLLRSFYKAYEYQSVDREKAGDLWRPVWDLLTPGPVFPVFTTNYDCVFEVLENAGALPAGMDFKRGFVAAQKDERFRWEANTLLDDVETSLLLHKLHGSVDWRKLGDTLWSRGVGDCDDRLDAGEYAFVVPALEKQDRELEDWTKQLYALLAAWLQHVPNWIVIGFSFRDKRIKKMFEEAIDGGHIREIIAIAPEASETREAAILNDGLDEVLDACRKQGPGSYAERIHHSFGTEECIKALSEHLKERGGGGEKSGAGQPPPPPALKSKSKRRNKT